MRASLKWGLGATLAACGVSLWVGDKSARVVAAVDRASDRAPVAHLVTNGAPDHTPSLPLPVLLEPTTLEPARRDIFEAVLPPPPPAPPAPKPFVGPPLPPPPPPPPPMTWRYLGSMTTPDGQHLVMLARSDQIVSVQSGTRLDDGYVVETVRADAVRLLHPPTAAVVELPVPPPSSAVR